MYHHSKTQQQNRNSQNTNESYNDEFDVAYGISEEEEIFMDA